MKTTKFLTAFFAMFYLAFVMSVSSCKKKEKEDPPTLPPSSSFVMDFSDFKQNKSGLALQDSTTDTTLKYNFNKAFIQASFWNGILSVGLAIPVAAFLESFKHQPELGDDDWWTWTYSVNVGFKTYTASLHGKIDGQQVNWEMYLSLSGGFTDFKWFTGTSDLNGTSGQWILYEKPEVPTTLLQIDWHNNSDGTADIKYMNVAPSTSVAHGAENGGYIMYGKTNNTPFNAFYNIYYKSWNNLVEINWNRTTKNGQIKNSLANTNVLFFNDTDFHCWDNNKYNTDCQ
ncbi:MAG: hypothetical protein A2046_13385 [Bacteroidetes bacterium GWA2_30_7]|nr:MAG: hypothetical protein A2046_13385 [Bacteroidetes bacterium GWA2_30_7]